LKLREETLALDDEVRRRHADKDRLESLGFSAYGDGDLNTYENDDKSEIDRFESVESESLGLESFGLDSARLDNLELDSYLAGSEPAAAEEKVELINLDPYYTENDTDHNNRDPFDIFKKK